MAGASGARSWLQTRHATWLTERRLKVATVSIFVAATLGSTVALKGSTPPAHDPGVHPVQHQVASPSAPGRMTP
jgi:hypothetical protein